MSFLLVAEQVAPFVLIVVTFIAGVLTHRAGLVDLALALLAPTAGASKVLADIKTDIAAVKQTVADIQTKHLTLADIQADVAAVKTTVADLKAAQAAK